MVEGDGFELMEVAGDGVAFDEVVDEECDESGGGEDDEGEEGVFVSNSEEGEGDEGAEGEGEGGGGAGVSAFDEGVAAECFNRRVSTPFAVSSPT